MESGGGGITARLTVTTGSMASMVTPRLVEMDSSGCATSLLAAASTPTELWSVGMAISAARLIEAGLTISER